MLAALKKNEKGLTLIELLAVLVIIGIIAAIAIPAIGSTIKNAETKSNEATRDMIKDAAQRYYMDTLTGTITGGPPSPSTETTYAGTGTDTSATFIQDLVDTGYLASLPALKGGKTLLGNITIKVTPNNGVFDVLVTLT